MASKATIPSIGYAGHVTRGMGNPRRDFPETWYDNFVDLFLLMAEIVVVGTGDRIVFVQRVREALAKMGIQVDVQDTVLFRF